MKRLALLLGLLALAGCDKLTGAADQKIADAEAIGFACRVAQKEPEACMKENEAYGPSSILDGWKSADEEIRGGKLNPKMGGEASSAKKEGDAAAPEGDKPAAKDEKPAEKTAEPSKDDKSAKTDTPAKPDVSKGTKPAEAKDKAKN